MDEHADTIINKLIEKQLEDKKNEYKSQLESWDLYKERIKRQTLEEFHSNIKKLSDGIDFLTSSSYYTPEEKDLLLDKFDHIETNLQDHKFDPTKKPYELYGINNELVQKGYQVAIEALDNGDIDNSMHVLTLLAYLDPSTYQYWLGLGMCNAAKENHIAALYNFYRALPTSQNDAPIVLLWIVDSMIAMGSVNEAKNILQKIIEISEETPGFEDAKARAKEKLEQLQNNPT